MVKGVNEQGEQSYYVYNGLGYLVANEYVVRQNNYGYVSVSTASTIPGVTVMPRQAIRRDYTLDYTSPLKNVITRLQRDWFWQRFYQTGNGLFHGMGEDMDDLGIGSASRS